MKSNVIALFLIAVMAVSVFAALDLTTNAQAATATVTTISVPKTASVGFDFPVHGTVKTSAGASVGTRGSVNLYRRSGTTWVRWKTVPVKGGSFYTTDQRGPGTHYYLARYTGYGKIYLSSTSPGATVVVKYKNYLTMSASRSGSAYHYVHGTLYYLSANRQWIPLSGKDIWIHKSTGEGGWRYVTHRPTDANGFWSAVDSQQPTAGTYYRARFLDDSTNWGTESVPQTVGPV